MKFTALIDRNIMTSVQGLCLFASRESQINLLRYCTLMCRVSFYKKPKFMKR